MTIQELFIASNTYLRKSVDQISVNQWGLTLPPEVSRKPTTIKQAVLSNTYDDAWVPDVLAGKTKEEVGAKYEQLLTNEDEIVKNYDHFNELAINSVKGFTDLNTITHLSYGDFTAREYLQHIISFRAFRFYDIAKLIGVDTAMDNDYIEALMLEFSPVIETYRQMGVFPAPIEVASEANPQTKLLAMVGRS